MAPRETRKSFKGRLFEYKSYKSYLNSYFRYRKQLDRRFSLEGWSRSLGMTSGSHLSRILSGERRPGDKIIGQFSDYFDFNRKESEYFENLVKLERVKKDPELSTLVNEKLRAINPSTPVKVVEGSVADALSKWYCAVIREMVASENFVEDDEWISSHLNFQVSAEKVREAIELMLNVGLLRRNRNKKLLQSEPSIETGHDVPSEAIKAFHEQNIMNSIEALRNFPIDQREFMSGCFNIDPNDIPEIKKEMREFRNRLVEKFEKPAGRVTMQYQTQAFPYTMGDIDIQ